MTRLFRICLLAAAIVISWMGLPGVTVAQVMTQLPCQNPTAPRIDIFYVNGITTTLDEARINAGKLEREFLAILPSLPANLRTFCYLFQLNYNPTDGEMNDFAEASQQRFGISPTTFWQALDSVTVFSPLLSRLQGAMTDANQIDQATIQRHAARYRQAILAPSCHRVLVVPHSQGNLYTNAAYDLTFAGPPPVPPAGALKIVGVATPDSEVRGNGRYRSSAGDSLINAIRFALSTTLKDNTDWGPSLLPVLTPVYSGGHSFIGYLTFNPSRNDIFGDIQESLLELASVNPCP